MYYSIVLDLVMFLQHWNWAHPRWSQKIVLQLWFTVSFLLKLMLCGFKMWSLTMIIFFGYLWKKWLSSLAWSDNVAYVEQLPLWPRGTCHLWGYWPGIYFGFLQSFFSFILGTGWVILVRSGKLFWVYKIIWPFCIQNDHFNTLPYRCLFLLLVSWAWQFPSCYLFVCLSFFVDLDFLHAQ